MGWADFAIKELQAGNTVVVKPTGNSMRPKIKSGAKVTLEPIKLDKVRIHDIVLCVVKGRQYLHKVIAREKDRVLIANNRCYTNGWTRKVYGIAIKIENGSNGKKNKKKD